MAEMTRAEWNDWAKAMRAKEPKEQPRSNYEFITKLFGMSEYQSMANSQNIQAKLIAQFGGNYQANCQCHGHHGLLGSLGSLFG